MNAITFRVLSRRRSTIYQSDQSAAKSSNHSFMHSFFALDVAAAELGAYFTDHVSFTMDTSELWIWAANLGDIQSVNVNIDGWVTRIKRNEFENKSVELQTNRETYLKQATFLLSHSE